MVVKIKIMLNILFLVLLIGTISAATITIDIKNSFVIGEDISFNYSITGSGENITFLAGAICPNAPQPPLDMKNVITPITQTYNFISVTSDIEPQICNASVLIIEPYELIETKTFTIDTNPSFNFKINTCKDISCSKNAKIFVKGETIYLNYNSEVSNPIINAILIYPNGTTQQVTIPTLIKAEQIGTYQLDISVSKNGYKTLTQSMQFGVISVNAEIGYTRVSNTSFQPFLIIAIIIIAIGILFSVIITKRLRKKSVTIKNKK